MPHCGIVMILELELESIFPGSQEIAAALKKISRGNHGSIKHTSRFLVTG